VRGLLLGVVGQAHRPRGPDSAWSLSCFVGEGGGDLKSVVPWASSENVEEGHGFLFLKAGWEVGGPSGS